MEEKFIRIERSGEAENARQTGDDYEDNGDHYPNLTAVPDAVTISMPLFSPRTS